jgi:hypothetical protein
VILNWWRKRRLSLRRYLSLWVRSGGQLGLERCAKLSHYLGM